MFTTIVLSLLGLITIIILRDGIHHKFFNRDRTKKTLKRISQYIVFHHWQLAEQELALLEGKKSQEITLLQIQVLRGTERYEEGLAIINEELKANNEGLVLHLEKGKILCAMGNYKEAYAFFSKSNVLLRTENDLIAYAESALGAEQYEEAWQIIKPLLNSTQNGDLFLLAGDIHLENKDFSKAIIYYHQALDLGTHTTSSMATTMTKLGHAYRRLGNLQEAERVFHQILEKDSGDVGATLGLGACYQERGQYLKALVLYQTGKAWEKKDPILLFQSGLLAMRIHHYSHAANYFAHLIEIEGETVELLTYFGYCLEKEKNWQKAEETYFHLLSLYPSHPDGYLALAWLFGVGYSCHISREIALSYAYHAVQLRPSSLSWEIVSACEARAGHFDKAHQIQELLASHETETCERNRRLEAMRHLRKHLPLDDQHVPKTLVA